MAANRKPKAAKRPKPNNGQRKARPVSDAAASPPALSAVEGSAPARSCAARVASVRSRGERRNRAGLSFNSSNPAIVRECEIGAERFDAILADRMLVCELQQ